MPTMMILNCASSDLVILFFDIDIINKIAKSFQGYQIFIRRQIMKRNTFTSKNKTFNLQDYVRPGLSLYQLQQIKEAFDLFDINSKGSFAPQELQDAMREIGYDNKNQILYNAVGECTSSIDFSKFVDLLTARSTGKQSKESLRRIFSLFDDEKTGFISLKNLRKIVKQIGQNIQDIQLQQMVDRADLDNDGLISEQQFYTIMTKNLK